MIGIFGGSFDPIHLGHLNLAENCMKLFSLREIVFVPNSQNPLKKTSTGASGLHRLRMVELAIQESGLPNLRCVDWEVSLPKPSYTLTTLQRFKASFPKSGLALILGDEVFQDFPRWHEPKKILELADILIATRRNRKWGVDQIHEVLNQLGVPSNTVSSTKVTITDPDKRSGPEGNLSILPIDALPYSATMLRSQLSTPEGQTTCPSGLLRSVWLYIKENQLYTVR